VLRKAAELSPRLAAIQYHLGLTYYRLGQKDPAVSALQRSLQLDEQGPMSADAKKILKELTRG
jgi:Flp pilus assembly protein TadD